MQKTYFFYCFTAVLSTCLLCIPEHVEAANRYWIGSEGNFSVQAHWSDTSGGVTCSCIPGSSDIAIFDSSAIGDATIDSDITLSGLSIESGYTGTISAGSNDVYIGSNGFSQEGGTFVAPTGTLTIQDGNFSQIGGIFSNANGTVIFDVGANTTVTASGTNFYNLIFTRTTISGTTKTITINNNLSVGGDLTLKNEANSSLRHVRIFGSGNPTIDVQGSVEFPNTSQTANILFGSTVVSNTLDLHIAGDLTLADGDGYIYSDVLFDGTGLQLWTKTAGFDYGDFTVDGQENTVRLNSEVSITNIGQDLTVQNGSLHLNAYDISVSGDFIVQSGASLRLNGIETLTTPSFQTGSTVVYAGAGTHTSLLLGAVYYNVAFDNAAGTWQPENALDINGTLSVLSGSFVHGSQPITIAGGLHIADGVSFTKSVTGSLIILDGGVLYNDQKGVNVGNIRIDADISTVILQSWLRADSLDIAINGAIDVAGYKIITSTGGVTNSGTLLLNGGSLSTQGDLINDGTFIAGGNGTVTLSGSFINADIFDAGSSTFVLNGTAQTLSGSSTFNNVTKTVSDMDTLTFVHSQTYTVQGTLQLQGSDSAKLLLRSSSGGTAWNLDPQGTKAVEHLNVQDSNNINATIMDCVTGCVDSGNNTNWNFTSSSISSVSSSANSSVAEEQEKDNKSGGKRGQGTQQAAAAVAFIEKLQNNPFMVIARNIILEPKRLFAVANIDNLPPSLITTGGSEEKIINNWEQMSSLNQRVFCRLQPRVLRRAFPERILERIAERLHQRWGVNVDFTLCY